VVVSLINWSKQRSLPGFFKVPIFDVVTFIRNEIRRDALSTRANSVAFSFFLSIFPSIIVLFTLLPFLTTYFISYLPGGENFMDVLYQEVKFILPGESGDMIFRSIEDITTRPRAGLLSFGFVLAVFFASNGMMYLMQGFEKSYSITFKKRGGFSRRIMAILLTFLLSFLLIASIILVILGNQLIGWLADYIRLDWFGEVSISVVRYMVIITLFYSGISLLYRFGANLRKRFGFFSPGATLATLLSLISSQVFSFYVDNFDTYNKLYGSIGTIIVIMLWIQINVFVILIGYELNASIAVHRDLKKEREEAQS
jgi:membrane protein